MNAPAANNITPRIMKNIANSTIRRKSRAIFATNCMPTITINPSTIAELNPNICLSKGKSSQADPTHGVTVPLLSGPQVFGPFIKIVKNASTPPVNIN